MKPKPEDPTDVGLRIVFWTAEGKEWDVIFGDFPDGKFPCSNGAYATVTAYDFEPRDGVLDCWRLEAPAAEVCLLETVPHPKKKGKNIQTPRGRVSFPFRLTAIR